MTLSAIVALVLILGGAFFALVAALGVLRMQDVYIRMHASTKAGTLGVGMIAAGAAVATGGESVVKQVLVILFPAVHRADWRTPDCPRGVPCPRALCRPRTSARSPATASPPRIRTSEPAARPSGHCCRDAGGRCRLGRDDAWVSPLESGGRHPHMGTHNRLLSLGPDLYLEVIAVDPDARSAGSTALVRSRPVSRESRGCTAGLRPATISMLP